jgi:hypothetical protein
MFNMLIRIRCKYKHHRRTLFYLNNGFSVLLSYKWTVLMSVGLAVGSDKQYSSDKIMTLKTSIKYLYFVVCCLRYTYRVQKLRPMYFDRILNYVKPSVVRDTLHYSLFCVQFEQNTITLTL